MEENAGYASARLDLGVLQCRKDALPSFTCQFLFTPIESQKTALARACCTSSFSLFTCVKSLVIFIYGEFDMSARPNWRELHGSLLWPHRLHLEVSAFVGDDDLSLCFSVFFYIFRLWFRIKQYALMLVRAQGVMTTRCAAACMCTLSDTVGVKKGRSRLTDQTCRELGSHVNQLSTHWVRSVCIGAVPRVAMLMLEFFVMMRGEAQLHRQC